MHFLQQTKWIEALPKRSWDQSQTISCNKHHFLYIPALARLRRWLLRLDRTASQYGRFARYLGCFVQVRTQGFKPTDHKPKSKLSLRTTSGNACFTPLSLPHFFTPPLKLRKRISPFSGLCRCSPRNAENCSTPPHNAQYSYYMYIYVYIIGGHPKGGSINGLPIQVPNVLGLGLSSLLSAKPSWFEIVYPWWPPPCMMHQMPYPKHAKRIPMLHVSSQTAIQLEANLLHRVHRQKHSSHLPQPKGGLHFAPQRGWAFFPEGGVYASFSFTQCDMMRYGAVFS